MFTLFILRTSSTTNLTAPPPLHIRTVHTVILLPLLYAFWHELTVTARMGIGEGGEDGEWGLSLPSDQISKGP